LELTEGHWDIKKALVVSDVKASGWIGPQLGLAVIFHIKLRPAAELDRVVGKKSPEWAHNAQADAQGKRDGEQGRRRNEHEEHQGNGGKGPKKV